MWRADENVSCFHGVNCLTCGRYTGVSCGNECCNDSYGLCVLHESFFGNLLDDSDALLSEAVSQYQLELVALVAFGYFVAESGFVNSFIADRSPDFERVERGADCSCEAVDSFLVICRDNFCCGFGLLHHFFKHCNFFRCYFMMCHFLQFYSSQNYFVMCDFAWLGGMYFPFASFLTNLPSFTRSPGV